MKHLLYFLSFFTYTTLLCAQSYTIYPIPQKLTTDGGSAQLTSNVNMVIESGVNEITVNRLEEVLTNGGFTFSRSNALVNDKTNVLVGVNGSNGLVDTYFTEHSISRSVFTAEDNKFDAHVLQLNTNHPKGDLLMLGDVNGSVYYAMASLEQMLEQTSNKNLSKVTIEDYAYTQYRGVVEGFYGRPWTVENRLRAFDYCKRYKLNLYVYGPKSDPYHLGKWKDNYPVTITEKQRFMGLITQDDLRRIATKSQACNVNFVWAAHPAMQNGINFGSEASLDSGIKLIMDKFGYLYDLGLRGFGIFIDDLNFTPSGRMQAYLADNAQKKLYEKFNKAGVADKDRVKPLFFVPTAYALNYGSSNTLYDLKGIHKDVVVAFTGYNCFSNVRGSACADMANRIGRNAVMWWNNPVNDDHDAWLYMREMTAHWTIEDVNPIPTLHGLMMNPMSQSEVSKVFLFGAADYSWNPAKFNTHTNWEAFFSTIIRDDKKMEDALKTFALNVDPNIESENLIQLYAAFKANYSENNLPTVTNDLLAEMTKINEACTLLLTLKDSDNEDYKALYEDIRCWVFKLKSMSGIVCSSLNLMKSKGQLDAWTDYQKVKEEYKKLHTDDLFRVIAFEDAGESTYEKKYDVEPSGKYMLPFIDYLMGKIDAYAPL